MENDSRNETTARNEPRDTAEPMLSSSSSLLLSHALTTSNESQIIQNNQVYSALDAFHHPTLRQDLYSLWCDLYSQSVSLLPRDEKQEQQQKLEQEGKHRDSWFEWIYGQHNNPTRHYHTAVHLREMFGYLHILSACQNSSNNTNSEEPDAAASTDDNPSLSLALSKIFSHSKSGGNGPNLWILVISYAIFFHDVVYNAKSTTNEEESAVIFRRFAHGRQVPITTDDDQAAFALANLGYGGANTTNRPMLPPIIEEMVVTFIHATEKHHLLPAPELSGSDAKETHCYKKTHEKFEELSAAVTTLENVDNINQVMTDMGDPSTEKNTSKYNSAALQLKGLPSAVPAPIIKSICDNNGDDDDNEEENLEQQQRHDEKRTLPSASDLVVRIDEHEWSLALSLFLDLDMSVLGKSWRAYMAYAGLIRLEYLFVPLETYCTKRSEILQSFLTNEGKDAANGKESRNTKPIYISQIFKDAFEDRARTNLAKEINMLQNGVTPCERNEREKV